MENSENTQRKLKKKNIILMIIITALLLLILAMIPAIIVLSSSYTVLIKDSGSVYFQARDMLVAGDHVLLRRDSMEYSRKKDAADAEVEDYDIAYLKMNGIISIEKLSDDDSDENVKKAKTYDVPKIYLGVYKINASGNEGYLYLSRYKKTGKIFGSIRFPDWAHGVFEPLKNLWIKNGKLGFIRSIETIEERRRVGAPAFFTQEYYGDYKEEGNAIEGYYINRGAKMMWRGYRVKRK